MVLLLHKILHLLDLVGSHLQQVRHCPPVMLLAHTSVTYELLQDTSVSLFSTCLIMVLSDVLIAAEPVTVPAAVAYACLRAIPVNKDDALALVDSMLPYLQFQSTLTYLKNPPSGYPFDSIDIFQAMEGIRDDVLQGSFESEYDFQLGISNTLASAHDGHLSWNGDTSTNIRFRRPFWLASLSSDGNAFPLIYAYNHGKSALMTPYKH